MKKITIMALSVAALTLASCGGQTPKMDNTPDSVAVADTLAPEVQAATDSLTAKVSTLLEAKDAKSLQQTLAELQVKYQELVKSGKLEEAKKYASAIQAFIADNAETIKTVTSGNTTIASLVEGIKNLPTSAETTAEEAVAAVKTDVTSLATTAATTAKAAAEQKATEAVEKAKAETVDKANAAVDAAQKKAAEKTNEAVNKASEKAGKAIGKALGL